MVERYEGAFPVQYIVIPNGGPSNARNVGSTQAQGRYLVILDSDVVLLPDYIKNVVAAINYYDGIGKPLDAFGGPDAAHEHFSNVQKAIDDEFPNNRRDTRGKTPSKSLLPSKLQSRL